MGGSQTSTESFGFSTCNAPTRQRFEAWERAISRSHCDWSLRPRSEVGPRAYRGRLEQLGLGECRVIRCACDPLTGARTAREVAQTVEPCFGIVYVRAGRESIRAPGLEMRLSSGVFALWDSEATMSFDVPVSLEKLSLLVPKRRLRKIVAEPERHLGSIVDARRGAAALVVEQLHALLRHGDTLDGDARRVDRIISGTLELLGAALLREVGYRDGHLGDAKAFIERRLDDPCLDPKIVAQALGVSVRTLHGWFHRDGQSVSRWVLHRRLERARQDLRSDLAATITQIAFRWGFNDAAYFSRAFRRAYGLSPRAWRRA